MEKLSVSHLSLLPGKRTITLGLGAMFPQAHLFHPFVAVPSIEHPLAEYIALKLSPYPSISAKERRRHVPCSAASYYTMGFGSHEVCSSLALKISTQCSVRGEKETTKS